MLGSFVKNGVVGSNTFNSHRNHKISLIEVALTLCYSYMEEHETKNSFLVFQEIGSPPRRSKYPMHEHLV